ncbi:MAG: hypothetical protein R6U98_08565, partial [Pirellulaceae bacterium]
IKTAITEGDEAINKLKAILKGRISILVRKGCNSLNVELIEEQDSGHYIVSEKVTIRQKSA